MKKLFVSFYCLDRATGLKSGFGRTEINPAGVKISKAEDVAELEEMIEREIVPDSKVIILHWQRFE